MERGLNRIEMTRLYREVRHRLLGDARVPLTIAGRVVRRRIGTGGSGLVYAAYDPALDGEVAIKVVPCGGDQHSRALVHQEARVLAEQNHPNVVTVYAIEDHHGDPCIVMALVQGDPLDVWMAAGREAGGDGGRARRGPSLAALCAVFAQVADGLQAVHAAGLVHRDIKPANIVVDADGRPQLIDFGITHATADDARDPRAGTPGYVAPELTHGGRASPASDQYAFFVTLRDAMEQRCVGEPVVPQSRRLDAFVRRGLHARPARRHTSMASVAQQLRAGFSRRERWRVAAVALGIAGVTAVMWSTPVQAPEQRCEQTEPWPRVPESIRAGLVQRAGAVGGQVADTLHDSVQQWQSRWTHAFGQVCDGTWRDEADSQVTFDRRMLCLTRQRQTVTAMLDRLGPDDPDTLVRAADALSGVELPASCVLDDYARQDRDPALWQELADASAQRRLGKFVPARAALKTIIDRAAPDTALYARANLELGQLDVQRGPPAATAATLQRAVQAAHAAGRFDLEASAWLSLLHLNLGRADDLPRAQRDLPHARASVALDRRPGSAVRLASIEARIALRDGELVEADRLMAVARAGAEALEPPRPALLATVLNNAAGIAARREDFTRARQLHARALRLRLDALGPAHPDVAMTQMNLAMLCEQEGDLAGARDHLDQVLRVALQVVGPDDPGLMRVYLPRARVLAQLGDAPRAVADAQRALALADAAGNARVAAHARTLLAELLPAPSSP